LLQGSGEYIARDGPEGVMYPVADSGHTHELELARLLHGDGQAELEGLLDSGGLGIDQPGRGRSSPMVVIPNS